MPEMMTATTSDRNAPVFTWPEVEDFATTSYPALEPLRVRCRDMRPVEIGAYLATRA